MTRTFPLVSVLLVTACAAPDITAGIDTFQTSLSAVEGPLLPTVRRGVLRETENAKQRAIANGALVYGRPVGCVGLVFGPTSQSAQLDVSVADCRLDPKFSAPLERGTNAYAAEGLSALRQYADVLHALNTSTVGADVATHFKGFLTSLNAFALANNKGGPNGPINTGQIEPLGNTLGRLVETRRAAITKKLVNAAHPQIKVVIAELIAHREGKENLLAQAEALNARYENLTDAQDSGNRGTYISATARYEAELAAFQKSIRSSDTGRLLALWKAHQILHAEVNGTGDPTALIDLLEDLKALSDS